MTQQTPSVLASVEQACFRVVALVSARLTRRDIESELNRIETQTRMRSYGEVGAVLGVLLGLTFLAASLGAWALAVLFVGIVLLFR